MSKLKNICRRNTVFFAFCTEKVYINFAGHWFLNAKINKTYNTEKTVSASRPFLFQRLCKIFRVKIVKVISEIPGHILIGFLFLPAPTLFRFQEIVKFCLDFFCVHIFLRSIYSIYEMNCAKPHFLRNKYKPLVVSYDPAFLCRVVCFLIPVRTKILAV